MTELTLTNTDLEDIKKRVARNLLVTEDVDHATFQVLATLRALLELFKERRIKAQPIAVARTVTVYIAASSQPPTGVAPVAGSVTV